MVFSKKEKSLVISKSDIEIALAHIGEHPDAYPNKIPQPWSRQRFLDELSDRIKEQVKTPFKQGVTFRLGFNMWGHIDYVGFDLARYSHDSERYQVYISVRSTDTNPDSFTQINL